MAFLTRKDINIYSILWRHIDTCVRVLVCLHVHILNLVTAHRYVCSCTGVSTRTYTQSCDGTSIHVFVYWCVYTYIYSILWRHTDTCLHVDVYMNCSMSMSCWIGILTGVTTESSLFGDRKLCSPAFQRCFGKCTIEGMKNKVASVGSMPLWIVSWLLPQLLIITVSRNLTLYDHVIV
jgi:hypothetical protein